MKKLQIKPSIQALYDLAITLLEGQMLFTTFGSNNYFTIEKDTFVDDDCAVKDKFIVSHYNDNWKRPFKGNKLIDDFSITSADDLENLLMSNEGQMMYVNDAFGRGLIHKDNYINFCKAFKICNIVETKDGIFYNAII